MGFHHHQAGARQFRSVIGRPQKARLLRKVFVNLAFVPDVIAGGEDVHAIAEQLLGQRWSNPESPGGVFTVGDGQMDIFGSYDFADIPGDQTAADGRKDVTDKEKVGNSSSYTRSCVA